MNCFYQIQILPEFFFNYYLINNMLIIFIIFEEISKQFQFHLKLHKLRLRTLSK
jgi:hypothetical protein